MAPFAPKPRRHESVNPYLLSIPLAASLRLHLSLSPCSVCVPLVPYVDGISMVSETDLSRLLPSFQDSFDTSWLLPVSITWRAVASLKSSYPTLAFYLFFFSSCLPFTSALYERCELPICWILYEHRRFIRSVKIQKNKSSKNLFEDFGFCLVQFLTREKTPRVRNNDNNDEYNDDDVDKSVDDFCSFRNCSSPVNIALSRSRFCLVSFLIVGRNDESYRSIATTGEASSRNKWPTKRGG